MKYLWGTLPGSFQVFMYMEVQLKAHQGGKGYFKAAYIQGMPVFFFFLLLSTRLYPQWGNNPDINLQLTNWGDAPLSAVEDGRGGAFVSVSYNAPLDREPWEARYPHLLWVDKYGYHNIDTAYRIGGYGEAYRDLKLMKDGIGNYFAVFVDCFFVEYVPPVSIYKYKIMIQKFDSSGNKLWGEGVYVTTDTVIQPTLFEAVADNKGGCFIYYEALDSIDVLSGTGKKIVQYISTDGERVWGDTGITLYTGGVQWNFSANNIMYSGNNGIITLYQNNSLINLDNVGNILWTLPFNMPVNGAYRMALLNQNEFIILGFKYYENPFSADLIFNKISLGGEYIDSSKTLIANIDGGRIENILIDSDEIFFTWKEYRSYLQKIDTTGNRLWNDKGIFLYDTTTYASKMFSTDTSLILVTDHYAQSIDFDGNNLWEPGVLQYTTRYMGYYDVVSDGSGGFISLWLQYLDGIWGQQVSASGNLGVVTSVNLPDKFYPEDFRLYQNYPNPFNPLTRIYYSLSERGYIELKVFDLLGNEIKLLDKGEKSEGLHSVLFDASELSSGVYFYSIFINGQSSIKGIYKSTKKMLLLK